MKPCSVISWRPIPAEASEIISRQWLLHVILLGLLPALLAGVVFPKTPRKPGKILLQKAATVAVALAVLVTAVFPFYERYAWLLRTHRHMRENVIPTAVLYSGYKYLHSSFRQEEKPLVRIATDARATHISTGKKNVLVLVVGETARAANFSLGGYSSNNTTPMLAKRMERDHGFTYFPNFFSCGTSTSISVPCMFSPDGRADFDVDSAKHTENLLDVLARAGVDVLWIDNNSGCKGVCDRIPHEDMRNRKDEGCTKYNCYDTKLAEELEKKLQSINRDTVIVLHQFGSHGPSYFKRVPEEFQQFKPFCRTNQLQECTASEIANSYDNTILYTDFVLDSLIGVLERASNKVNPAFLYVSDHGESLGEYNLYLHGMPWNIAPDEQKHVPALIWLSEGFRNEYGISNECLHSKAASHYSHDNLFPTMLGMMEVETAAYKPELDLLHGCQEDGQRRLAHKDAKPADVKVKVK
jgi:lipid A ethanolaminephosphotransferase